MGTHPIFESDFDCLTEMRLLISFVFLFKSISAGPDCGNTSLIKPLCDVLNGTIQSAENEPSKCIDNDNKVIGLSWAFCGKSRLPEDDISENLIFVDFRQGICVYTEDQTSIGDLYAATKLQQLFVDKVCDKCPGSFNVSNWESNSTLLYEPWHSDFISQNDYGICTAPKSFCHFDGKSNAFNNYTCPKNSKCIDHGVGSFDCQCSEGYHGYRCMESGSFPFAVVMTVTPTVGIVLTAGLWYIGRRHVIKQD